jgi:hypothetical protein
MQYAERSLVSDEKGSPADNHPVFAKYTRCQDDPRNATILNASVVNVAEAAINAFGSVIKEAGLNQGKLFLTETMAL